jgi:hypothetical protein
MLTDDFSCGDLGEGGFVPSMEDDFNRPDSALTDDPRWIAYPGITSLSVVDNTCQSVSGIRRNLTEATVEANSLMKFDLISGDAWLAFGLRMSVDAQNGYQVEINSGLVRFFGLLAGVKTEIGRTNVTLAPNDEIVFQAIDGVLTLTINQVDVGSVTDSTGLGPGEVAGRAYLATSTGNVLDDFLCGASAVLLPALWG